MPSLPSLCWESSGDTAHYLTVSGQTVEFNQGDRTPAPVCARVLARRLPFQSRRKLPPGWNDRTGLIPEVWVQFNHLNPVLASEVSMGGVPAGRCWTYTRDKYIKDISGDMYQMPCPTLFQTFPNRVSSLWWAIFETICTHCRAAIQTEVSWVWANLHETRFTYFQTLLEKKQQILAVFGGWIFFFGFFQDPGVRFRSD